MKLLASEAVVLLRRSTASALHRYPPLPLSRRCFTVCLLLRSLGGLLCAAVVATCKDPGPYGPKTGATGRPTPVAVAGGLTFARLTAGGGHTCGVTTSGAAYCWGSNGAGELGNGSTANSSTPVAVAGGFTFAAVSAGGGHTCGVTTSGAAHCWGSNGNGQLGIGALDTLLHTTPVAVAGGLTFASLTAGSLHTCGVTSGGAVYCWGSNNYGTLGDGTTTYRTTPVAVAGGLTFANVTAGFWHTCGLTSGGAAYCWGWSVYGNLGDSSTALRTTPVAVAGGLTFASLTAGPDFTCGVTNGGAAYCWGANFFGALGDGSAPGQVTTPVAVVGGLTFAGVTAGSEHTCGLTSGGAAYCWGYNYYGELGNGSTSSSLGTTPAPVAVVGGLTFTSLTAGAFHTCGLTSGGAAYCWGSNEVGQLGAANP
jgi:alpha-tubulin suppressor-like RCC1 family protein